MRIVPQLVWRFDGEDGGPLDPRLLPLLDAIAASQSLAAAVAACGISYRAGWGLLRDCHRLLGTPLVTLERGRGASLTPAGEHLRTMHRQAALRLARILPGLAFDVGAAARPAARAARVGLRAAASHDLALAALAGVLPDMAGLDLELSFMGSLVALTEFAEGRVALAGFHVALAGAGTGETRPFLRLLRAQRDRLIRVADRDQGLILRRARSIRVKRFRDIAALGLRFVNRQKGSGTRLLIDRLVAAEGLAAADLDGYGKEEFTHAAVAATVASGGADAGFGLRAAAAEYRLAFVPLVRERYYLAVRARDVDSAGVARLIGALASPAFGDLARRLPGYRPAGAGSVVGVDVLAGPVHAP
jgi:molybdate transport repressor ModE-like protein